MLSTATRALLAHPAAARALVVRRGFSHSTWISGFPRTRISFPEKVAHGVVIAVGSLTVPVWILCNLHNYQK